MRHNLQENQDVNLSVSEVTRRYAETVEELERFSRVNPRDIVDHDEIEKAEGALLDYEAYLLGKAAKMPLKTDDDFNAILDLWAAVSKSADEDCLQSNKLAMNIFRHLNR